MTTPAQDPSAIIRFVFESQSIRVQLDANGEPWFVAKDVFDALDIHWAGERSLLSIPDEWRMVVYLTTIQGERSTLLISEPAVYKIAFRSRKPAAEAFTNRVAQIITTIRKTGRFEAQPSPLADHELNKLAWEICHNLWPEVRRALAEAACAPGADALVRVVAGRDYNGAVFARALGPKDVLLSGAQVQAAGEALALLRAADAALLAGLNPASIELVAANGPFPARGGPRR